MAEIGDKIGAWAFIAGLVIALVFAFVAAAPWVTWLLGALGVVIGLLNIGDKETQGFLVAAIAFVIAGSALSGVFGVDPVDNFLANVTTLIGPATAIVAIKALYDLAKD